MIYDKMKNRRGPKIWGVEKEKKNKVPKKRPFWPGVRKRTKTKINGMI